MQGIRWDRVFLLLVVIGVIYLISNGGIATSPPPFKTDKLAVLVVEPDDVGTREKLTLGQQQAILGTGAGSLRDFVSTHGGEWRLLEAKNATATAVADDLPWVKEAIKVERKGDFWMVAANPKSGVSVALPENDAAIKLLQGMGEK